MRTTEQGMTLVAGLVISLAASAAVGLQLRALQAGEQARRESQAVQLAHGLLERARLVGTVEAEALNAWQTLISASLGAGATGRALRLGEQWLVEVTWPDGQEGHGHRISLLGKISP